MINNNQNNRIPFNRPTILGTEENYIHQVLENRKFSGGGPFTKKCVSWFKHNFNVPDVFLTTSGSHALEMAALMCDLQPGDEVIVPSYAFPTTASAFVRCGANIVFVDIEAMTMNIDINAIAKAITKKTKVIVALHYAGVSCNMVELMKIAETNNLIVVEDAAHAIFSQYQDQYCGTIGTFGCLSFHESKNIHCGEGGLLICNDSRYRERAEIVLEKGTNRIQFFNGAVEKYRWLEIGSSYVMSELNAAYLFAQLEHGLEITKNRLHTWAEYQYKLKYLVENGSIETATIPEGCQHNGHMFWIKTRDFIERNALMNFLGENGIQSVFHYQPLHQSAAGKRYGRFVGKDLFTTVESERILRLPLYYNFKNIDQVVGIINQFYKNKI